MSFDERLDTAMQRSDASHNEQPHQPAEGSGTEPELGNDPMTNFARVQARAAAAEAERTASLDRWVDGQVGRIKGEGVCCNSGPHFDERGVLETLLQLGPPYTDIDRAWKTWHDQTFETSAKGKSLSQAIEDIADANARRDQYRVQRFKPKQRDELARARSSQRSDFEHALDAALARAE